MKRQQNKTKQKPVFFILAKIVFVHKKYRKLNM